MAVTPSIWSMRCEGVWRIAPCGHFILRWFPYGALDSHRQSRLTPVQSASGHRRLLGDGAGACCFICVHTGPSTWSAADVAAAAGVDLHCLPRRALNSHPAFPPHEACRGIAACMGLVRFAVFACEAPTASRPSSATTSAGRSAESWGSPRSPPRPRSLRSCPPTPTTSLCPRRARSRPPPPPPTRHPPTRPHRSPGHTPRPQRRSGAQ